MLGLTTCSIVSRVGNNAHESEAEDKDENEDAQSAAPLIWRVCCPLRAAAAGRRQRSWRTSRRRAVLPSARTTPASSAPIRSTRSSAHSSLHACQSANSQAAVLCCTDHFLTNCQLSRYTVRPVYLVQVLYKNMYEYVLGTRTCSECT